MYLTYPHAGWDETQVEVSIPSRTFTEEMKALEREAEVDCDSAGRYTVRLWGQAVEVTYADLPNTRPFAAARRTQGRLRALLGLPPLFPHMRA